MHDDEKDAGDLHSHDHDHGEDDGDGEDDDEVRVRACQAGPAWWDMGEVAMHVWGGAALLVGMGVLTVVVGETWQPHGATVTTAI